MAHYQKVIWHHEFPDDPVVLFSEVADHGVETRKVAVFRDGRSQFADATRSTGDTLLSEEPLPSLEEIDDKPEFSVSVIQQSAFELIWARALGEPR